jgi:glycosyltransferase involved in cell wall biosynthesis
MRILVVNVHFDPESFGGATIVAEETAAHLAQAGHEVVVATAIMGSRLPPGRLYRYEARGLPVVAIGRPLPESVEQEYHQPGLAVRMRQLLHSVRPDIVHFHAVQGLGVELLEAVHHADVPAVVTLHDAWWFCERQFMVRADGTWCGQTAISASVCAGCVPHPARHVQRQSHSRELLNRCARVLTPSAYWAGVMTGSGVDAERVQVNRNGVYHPRPGFRRTPYGGVTRFGYVGGDTAIKGVRQIRRALAGLARSDYTLRLVDAGLNLGVQSLRPEDWQYPGLVQIVPGYTHRGLDDFFDSIDVLLFPSQWRESYGLTVREAVLRGVWVIATDGGGTAEDLADGVNSTLIPMGSAAALRAAMTSAMDDPAAFRDRARTVRPIPTFADQTAELVRIYESVLAG